MNKPEDLLLITIIIPIYNREKMLQKTLESILCQIYRPIELILVDNGSEDNSLEICQKFQETFSCLFLDVKVIQEMKKGANAARNSGLAIATGDYVIFFDSDDEMFEDCIANIVGELIIGKYPKAVAVTSYVQLPDGTRTIRPKHISKNPADHLFDTVIPTHSICIKRSVLNDIGPWDEDLERWQDLEFGFRTLLQTNDIEWFKDKPLYEVFQHDDSISGKSYFEDHEKMYASLMKIKATIEKQKKGLKKRRQQRALCYKICSIGAQLRKEGHPDLGKNYLKKALAQLPFARIILAHCLLHFQYLYEGKGGRGLWRVSRILL